MQAARQTFSNSGFPVCIVFLASLASTCRECCYVRNFCQRVFSNYLTRSITTPSIVVVHLHRQSENCGFTRRQFPQRLCNSYTVFCRYSFRWPTFHSFQLCRIFVEFIMPPHESILLLFLQQIAVDYRREQCSIASGFHRMW